MRQCEKKHLIVVYGTQAFGKLATFCLHQLGIYQDFYANKEGGASIDGIPLLDLEKLKFLYVRKKVIVLLATGRSSKEVIHQLETQGIDVLYSIHNLLNTVNVLASNLSDNLKWEYVHRHFYLFLQNQLIRKNDFILESLDLVVTEKCSLRCSHCSNLMQYYQRPKNIDNKLNVQALDRLLRVVDLIGELRILGGEPFMNPEFTSLVERYYRNDRILKIVIYSNATIFPNDDVLRKLRNRNVLIRFSNYGILSRNLERWVDWCKKNAVEYIISSYEKWHDCGALEKHHYSFRELKSVFVSCDCRNLPTLLRGRLYNCPYAAHAANLGAVPLEEANEDCLSLESDNISYSRRDIEEFLYHKDYLMACDYCKGRNFNHPPVKPHQQLEKPLEYCHVRSNFHDKNINYHTDL